MSARPLRLLIIGAGRMGRAIAAEATARGHQVIGMIGRAGLAAIESGSADCAIEFTVPDAAEAVCRTLLDAGLPVVSGTTGWDAGVAGTAARVRAGQGAFVHAANYSIGVQLLLRGARALGEAFSGQTGFDAVVTETHHAAKLDAPSGTARLLQQTLQAADATRAYPITSVRVGHVPGTHEVIFDGAFEQIVLRHEARDRRIFAAGAVTAAERLAGRTGVFSFAELLFGAEA